MDSAYKGVGFYFSVKRDLSVFYKDVRLYSPVKAEGLGGLYKSVGLYFPVKGEGLGGKYKGVWLYFSVRVEELYICIFL